MALIFIDISHIILDISAFQANLHSIQHLLLDISKHLLDISSRLLDISNKFLDISHIHTYITAKFNYMMVLSEFHSFPQKNTHIQSDTSVSSKTIITY